MAGAAGAIHCALALFVDLVVVLGSPDVGAVVLVEGGDACVCVFDDDQCHGVPLFVP